jgi:hypothetical protein
MTIHSPFTKPTERANRTDSAPAAVTPSRCMRRSSAIVLWSGASRPATTSTRYFAGTPPPTAARNGSAGDSRSRVDHNQAARSRPRRARSPSRHVQPVHKRVDYPADMIVRDQLFQTDRKQCSLGPAFSLHKARKKCPRFREGISSFIYRRATEFRNSLTTARVFFTSY